VFIFNFILMLVTWGNCWTQCGVICKF
jgi:hypothetical protein